MSGTLWAAASGIGFGAFQTVNRRAIARMDVYVATLLQLAVALAVLVALVVAGVDRDRVADMPLASAGWFVLGGGTHFFVGWTLLNMSHSVSVRRGRAR